MAYASRVVSRVTWYTLALLLFSISIVVIVTTIWNNVVHHAISEMDVSYDVKDDYVEYAVMGSIRQQELFDVATSSRLIVVPHHLVAGDAIARGMKYLLHNTEPISTIIVISPDHFHTCPNYLCTTKGVFNTFFGSVQTKNNNIDELTESPYIEIEKTLFYKEHGMYVLMPFLSYYFPRAEVVPLVVSQKQAFGKKVRESVLLRIISNLNENTAIVISSDFSHYETLESANNFDRQTREVLSSRNSERILALQNPQQSDCPNCMWLANEIATHLSHEKIYFPWHSNSASILNVLDTEETTSHFLVIYSDT